MTDWKREKLSPHLYPDHTYHLEMVFDSPLPHENTWQGKKLLSNQYSFIDLDDPEKKQYTYFATTGSKVDKELIKRVRGDRIDLTFRQGINRVGKPTRWYDVYEFGKTPESGSRRQFDPIPDPNYRFPAPPNQGKGERRPDGVVEPRDIPKEQVTDIDPPSLSNLF